MLKKILLVTLLLFILACGTEEESKNQTYVPTGTQGVVMELTEATLPNIVYENQGLNYVIKFTNKGSWPSKNTKLMVSGDKGYMEFGGGNHIYEQSGPNLRGKSTKDSSDHIEVVEIPIKINKIDEISETHEIITSLCYDYGSEASFQVCVDPDPHGTTSQAKGCYAQDFISGSQGQGGPIVVEKIEPHMLLQGNNVRPLFKFLLINKGPGMPTSPGITSQMCGKSTPGTAAYNTVKFSIKMSKFPSSNFECYPKDVIFSNQQGTITCEAKSGIPKTQGAYPTPLTITLNYGYTQSISKQIKIQKISR